MSRKKNPKSPVPVKLTVHSSDLTAECMRSVRLRLEGKQKGEYTASLYLGQLIHLSLAKLHEARRRWDFGATRLLDVERTVSEAVQIMEGLSIKEGRPISLAVSNNISRIIEEAQDICKRYVIRLGPILDQSFSWVERPVSFETQVFKFASHIDLLFRDKDTGRLHIWDWKMRRESPTFEYLSRNLQMSMYAAAAVYGKIRVGDDDDTWINMNEIPVVSWIHLPNLRPYARGGSGYKKGDDRDLNKIIRSVEYTREGLASAILEANSRALAMGAGYWPTNPEPTRCLLCESRSSCVSFSSNSEGGQSDGESAE